MEGDLMLDEFPQLGNIFQSTPSAWRATKTIEFLRINYPYFNPRPPHGGRLFRFVPLGFVCFISIHALRMEGDPNVTALMMADTVFQSTPSAWRATRFPSPISPLVRISIHALRMEGDLPAE